MTLPIVDIVAGARPNFMKVAPILRRMAAGKRRLQARLVHTGQHYDEGMSAVFFRELGIREPDVHLEVGSGTHGQQTARVLERFESHLMATRPAGVVVVGDVNSTMACTVAAAKLGIPVAHVEAGLRSRDRSMPEEINRIITDAIADLLLVSEPAGEANLRAEGIPAERIRYAGNVMIDTLAAELPAARREEAPARFGVSAKGYAYVTLHRPSNVDEPAQLARVCAFLTEVARRMPVVFPVHPRTRGRLEAAGLLDALVSAPGVQLHPPLGYREGVGLMADARLVLTDSGGIQEETSFLDVPCLTLRPTTERPATVEMGSNTVIADDFARGLALVDDIGAGRYRHARPIPGWDGQAAGRIVEALEDAWGGPRG